MNLCFGVTCNSRPGIRKADCCIEKQTAELKSRFCIQGHFQFASNLVRSSMSLKCAIGDITGNVANARELRIRLILMMLEEFGKTQ